jgi:hypothetical protein
MIEQRRDQNAGVVPVGGTRQGKVTLFAIETNFLEKRVTNLLERFPVVQTRDPEIITSLVQV